MAEIVERTDGIPLFVEEMTKAVLEAESEGEARHIAAAVPSPALALPASLHASLMARLDRLGPAKEVAQIGAVIGREFSHTLLAAVVRRPKGNLDAALDRLIDAGLLFRQGVPPHATYLFKHALVQDAAYGTLLREPRRALHARIAQTLENQFAEIAEVQPELLARHCTEAGLMEKAAGLWGKAGQRSLARSALVEAIELLSRALAQIATLPATPELRREQIELQVAIITPIMQVKGYAAPETKAAVEQARLLIEQAEALGEPPEDPLLLFSVLNGFWLANYAAGNGDVMRALADQFLALAGSKVRPSRFCLGIAWWVPPCCIRETSRKRARTSIGRSRSTTRSCIARLQRDLAKTSAWQAYSDGRGSCGRLGCASAAGKVMGTARCDKHGAPLARSGEAAASSRTARSGLRLVHRRLRHARSEGGEGVS